MDKLYISKTVLQELLNQANYDYPKPMLYIITIILVVAIMLLAVAMFIVIMLGLAAYALLFWVDILVGKYIIKRILKL
jgi:hypothetical protein